MRITSITAAIAMLTIGSVGMAHAAETFDTMDRVQAVPMTGTELVATGAPYMHHCGHPPDGRHVPHLENC